MKKYIFILGLSLFSFSSFLISCSDDDDDDKTTKMCTCIETDDYSDYSATRQLDPASYGATNCSDLAVKLRMAAGEDSDFWYDCY